MVRYYGRARQITGTINTNQPGLKQAGCPSTVGKQGKIVRFLGRRVNCNLKTCGGPMSGLRCKYGVRDAIGADKLFIQIQNSNNPAIEDYCDQVINKWNGIYCQWPQPKNRQMAGGVGNIWTPRRDHCEKTCSLGWQEVHQQLYSSATLSNGIDDVLCYAQQAAQRKLINVILKKIIDPSLKILYTNCYLSSINTTVSYDAAAATPTTNVISGGWKCSGPPCIHACVSCTPPPAKLSAMWIRDAAAQIHSYLTILEDTEIDKKYKDAMDKIIVGFIENAATCLAAYPTAHAFDQNQKPDTAGIVYEADSPAFFLWLVYDYYEIKIKISSNFVFSPNVLHAIDKIIDMYNDTLTRSPDPLPPLPPGQKNLLLPTAFRPSDDPVLYPFNIPINMFIETVLKNICKIGSVKLRAVTLANAEKIYKLLETNIPIYGISGNCYIYETNTAVKIPPSVPKFTPLGYDDANLPCLLSIPYLSPSYSYHVVERSHNKIYTSTRQKILSSVNPYYYTGTYNDIDYDGIGSPHTQQVEKLIWPLNMVARGYTSTSKSEKQSILHQLISSAALTLKSSHWVVENYGGVCADKSVSPGGSVLYTPQNYLHESFAADNPLLYTRGWFAWPNSFFGEWLDKSPEIPYPQ